MSQIAAAFLLMRVIVAWPEQMYTEWRQGVVIPFGLLVASNRGGDEVERLHYAHRDAEKMRDVLVELGEFTSERTKLVLGQDAEEVIDAMDEVQGWIQKAKAEGHTVMLIFYYSGHAKDGHLLLDDTRLATKRIKKWLRSSPADVRIAFIDTCQAGEMTRMKGGVLAPSMVEVEHTRGEIVVTSSSANEGSQESDEIGGSFFTHFLTSGLRGAADLSGDGKVSVREVYEYAYNQTVNRTAGTRGGTQHPAYGYQLTGQGDIVLTRTVGLSCGIDFPADLSGDYLIYDLKKLSIVAEVTKSANRPVSITVMPGIFVVKKRRQDDLLLGEFVLDKGQRLTIRDENLMQVSYEDDLTKGLVSVKEKTKFMAYSLRVGAQAFFDAPTRKDLFYSTLQAGAQIEFFGIISDWVSVALDILLGSGRDSTRIELEGGLVEQVEADFFRLEIGAGMHFHLFKDWIRLYAGPRLSFLVTSRELGDPLENWSIQTYSTLSPGISAGIAIPIGDFELCLEVRAHYLYYNIESNTSLGYGGVYLGVAYRK